MIIQSDNFHEDYGNWNDFARESDEWYYEHGRKVITRGETGWGDDNNPGCGQVIKVPRPLQVGDIYRTRFSCDDPNTLTAGFYFGFGTPQVPGGSGFGMVVTPSSVYGADLGRPTNLPPMLTVTHGLNADKPYTQILRLNNDGFMEVFIQGPGFSGPTFLGAVNGDLRGRDCYWFYQQHSISTVRFWDWQLSDING